LSGIFLHLLKIVLDRSLLFLLWWISPLENLIGLVFAGTCFNIDLIEIASGL